MFQFKQFTVEDSHCALKVGTDGVLIGAWCNVEDARRVLDVGTGCGVIALMIAQRNPSAQIDAIEIDLAASTDARLNFSQSPWRDRLHLVEGDFNQYETAVKYDLIVSNPPFFIDGILPTAQSKTVARHDESLSYGQLIKGASELLAENGRLAFIAPSRYKREITEFAIFNSLNVSGIAEVKSVPSKPVTRHLWELSRQLSPMQRGTIIIRNADGSYSDQYCALCADFYLHF